MKTDPLWTTKLEEVKKIETSKKIIDENSAYIEGCDENKKINELENYNEEKKINGKKEEVKVENWLNLARKNLKKIENSTPGKLKPRKHENLTPGSGNKRKKVIIGKRKNSRVSEIRKLWEKAEKKIEVNEEMKINEKSTKKINTIDEKISNHSARMISDVGLDKNTMKIVSSPVNSKFKNDWNQTSLDSWIKK